MNVTIDGADADGKPHPITGDATSDARSVRKIDDHTLGAPRRPRTLPVFAHEAMSPATGKSKSDRAPNVICFEWRPCAKIELTDEMKGKA